MKPLDLYSFSLNRSLFIRRKTCRKLTLKILPALSPYLAAIAALFPGVSRDIGGTSVSSNPTTNIGSGAPLPHRLSSQRARVNLISGRDDRSRIILDCPR